MCIGSTWRFSVCLGSFLLSICKLFVSNADSVCSYWHSKRSYFNFVFGRRVSWLINLDSCFNCCDVEEFEWIMIECLREVLQWDQRGSHFPSHATIAMLPGTTTSNLRGGVLKNNLLCQFSYNLVAYLMTNCYCIQEVSSVILLVLHNMQVSQKCSVLPCRVQLLWQLW